MGVRLDVLGATVGAVLGIQVGHAFGVGEPWVYVVAALAGATTLAIWIYSPLPDTNGGFMAGPTNTGWGWNTDEE